MIYDFVIIGAGISGLYTNYLLKKTNIKRKILILESSNIIGGRILTDGKSSLGAKFLHNSLDEFVDLKCASNEFYYLGSLTDKSKNVKMSMKLEDSGSVSKHMHPHFKYSNEINIRYNFSNLLKTFSSNSIINLNSPFRSYSFLNGNLVVNDRYTTKRLIFAVPINILKQLETPYRNLFENWYQVNIITLSFELQNHNSNMVVGFFFNADFKRTSFFYDKSSNVLYVNLYDRASNYKPDNIIKRICKKYKIKHYTLKQKDWVNASNLLGGWTIPTKSVSDDLIKTIENGYLNKIYYIGDYLGEIANIGSVTNAMKSVEKLNKLFINV